MCAEEDDVVLMQRSTNLNMADIEKYEEADEERRQDDGAADDANAAPPPELSGMGDKLLFSMPKRSEIWMMASDGSSPQSYIKKSVGCPNMKKSATSEAATAMMGRPTFIATDVASNRMFWGDWLGGTGQDGTHPYKMNASILSSPLNQAQVDPVATSAFFSPPPGHPLGIPGCDRESSYLCPPADIHIEAGGNLPITHLDVPTAMAVDPLEKMVYWSDRAVSGGKSGAPSEPKIYRSSYDGFTKQPEEVPIEEMIGETMAIAIDYREGSRKIYWVEYVNAKVRAGKFLVGSEIRRANLDGTDNELLASYLARHPTGFQLDLVEEKFYWTEYTGGEILRCPLKGCLAGDYNIGSKPELVLKTFEGPFSSQTPKLGALALDPNLGKIYWTENHEHSCTAGADRKTLPILFDSKTCGQGDEECRSTLHCTNYLYKIWGGTVMMANMKDGSEKTELYRYVGENSLHKAHPMGLSLVITTQRTTTTTTTTTEPPTTTTATVTMKANCLDLKIDKRYDDGKRPWEDNWGYTCQEYVSKQWCTLSGDYGAKWRDGDDWTVHGLSAAADVTAPQACCGCGGGRVGTAAEAAAAAAELATTPDPTRRRRYWG